MVTLDRVSKSRIDVSLVIAAHNRVQLTRACLDTVFSNAAPGIAMELIVVNDCSSDGTDKFLESLGRRIRVITNDVRRGFGENMNRAAGEARGDYLCFLNNDTLVTPGWLEKLLDAARRDATIGVIGNLQITPATGKIDHAGMVFDKEYRTHHLYRHMDASYPPAHLTREFQMVTGACWLLTKRFFLEMDGFDPLFKNGCEDADFCLRARRCDRKVLYVGESMIYHHGASSPGRMDHEEANLEYFYRKWRGQIKPDLDDYLHRDRAYCSQHNIGTPESI
jgi:O-antigen biosynthesis protein